MAVVSRAAGGYRFQNDSGDFVVYTDVLEEGGRVAGPGYVASWTAPDGRVLVDGLEAGFVSANDPGSAGSAPPPGTTSGRTARRTSGGAVGRSTPCAAPRAA
jgi:hypothetical protein